MTAQLNSIGEIVEALEQESGCRILRREETWAKLEQDGLGVLLALPGLWQDPQALAGIAGVGGTQRTLLICLGQHQDMAHMPHLGKQDHVAPLVLPTSTETLKITLETSTEMVKRLHQATERGQLAERYQFELGELMAIARAINSERDYNRLLGLILEKSRYVTGADAGSIYVLEAPDPDRADRRLLKFEVAQNESLEVDFKAFTIEVSERSIVGAAVVRKEIINIPDLYDLERHNPWGVEHDRSFDERTGYRTRSVLTVPLIDHHDKVIGVLQLINKKTTPGRPLKEHEDFDSYVVPFDEHSVELCNTLASQAGISLENALLYKELQQVFEGFVDASVQAIEARDPTTSGHSRRVAILTVGLAEIVDREESGPFRVERFTEDDLKTIEYAGLLHDFGKIGVPEAVLVKARKLYDWEREMILARFDYIRQWQRAETMAKKLEVVQKQDKRASMTRLSALDDALHKQEEYLDLCLSAVLEANLPSVMDQDRPKMLKEIAQHTFVDPRGERKPYLSLGELECLSIMRGSLSGSERQQIQSHVEHTYNYLQSIPWGIRFGLIPRIAGDHHEKLDGTGYPRGKPSEKIPIQAKMMAIADIFDALTASDRPYKKACPVERALDILKSDVSGGKLDADLFRLFIDAEIYKLVL